MSGQVSVTWAMQERRRLAWCRMAALAEEAGYQNRSFTPAEQQQWDELNEEVSQLDRRIALVSGLRVPGGTGAKREVIFFVRQLTQDELMR